VLVRLGIEGALDLLAGLVAHAAVEDEDALVGTVGAADGLGEEVLIIALGITVLGEENDAAGRPGALVGGQVAGLADARAEFGAHPGEQGSRLAVGLATGLLREGAYALQEVGGLGRRGGQGGRGGAHLGVLLGGERLVVDAVRLGVVADLGLDGADLDAAGPVDGGDVYLEGAGEGLGARQQALLQVDEDEAGAPARYRVAVAIVLETLVRKIDTVQRELGSIGAVLMDEMERTLDPGITANTAAKLASIGADARSKTADAELEGQRKNLERLASEVHTAGQRLEESRRVLEVSAESLRGVVDIGLELAGAAKLVDGPATSSGRRSFILPELDRSWQSTLDVLRPPRGREEALWEWRKQPPKPVTFEPLDRLNDDAEQLHLAHPFIKRILDRFLAQGFGAHDLSRVCGVVVPGENVARVLAYARLTLFGPGAARLHDELIAVSAPWPKASADIAPYKDSAIAARAREVSERALATGGRPLPTKVAEQARARAPELFAALWPHLQVEADARGVETRNSLSRRARKESDELRDLLERQRTAIRAARANLSQQVLPQLGDQAQQRQVELDLEHLAKREGRIADELTEEPKAIEEPLCGPDDPPDPRRSGHRLAGGHDMNPQDQTTWASDLLGACSGYLDMKSRQRLKSLPTAQLLVEPQVACPFRPTFKHR